VSEEVEGEAAREWAKEPPTAWPVSGDDKEPPTAVGVDGRKRRGEGAGRVNARRWRVKGEPMGLSYFHTF
jgi:hypothetical protein